MAGRASRLLAGRIRFDRNELAGAFGDIGTDLPLIVGMLLAMRPAAGEGFVPLVAGVFAVFGLAQIATGLAYGLPMPVQPLKAMAAIVIANGLAPDVLFGGGLAVGALMLVLAGSGALAWLVRVIPRAAVRGVQLGLGLTLARIALVQYVPDAAHAGGTAGLVLHYAIAAGAAGVVLALWGNRRLPAALLLVAGGLVWAVGWRLDLGAVAAGFGVTLPTPRLPSWDAIATGFVVLALPQVPLSLSNALIGTAQTARDLFPDRAPSATRLGFTYAALNLAAPVLGGIPVCHGAGGLAGHHAFGARTGGSVVIYGALYLGIGLCFAGGFTEVVKAFPLTILGVLLLFEAVALMRLVGDVAADRRALVIALLVGVLAASVPYGFLVGLGAGTACWYLWRPKAIH